MGVRIIKTGTAREFQVQVLITITASATNDEVTAPGHGLTTGQEVDIAGHSGSTPVINGLAQAITVVDENIFTIDGVDITVGGTGGTVTRYGQRWVGDVDRLTYDHADVEDTVTVKFHGEVIFKKIPLADFTDNADAAFPDFATFITYVAG